METTLIFEQGMELPEFASFPLVETEEGRAALRAYFEPYLAIARERGVGILLDAPTWRANPDWGAKLGYSLEQLEAGEPRGGRVHGRSARRGRRPRQRLRRPAR